METAYDGRQVVGMDLHRRRSVIIRKNADGELLSKVHIDNSPEAMIERRWRRPARGGARGGGRGDLWLVLGG